MKRIGLIDIGSNSMRLVLVDLNGKFFRIYNEFKEFARLGQGVNNNGMLQEDRIDFGISVLSMFKNICESTNTEEIIAVATAAVRNAKNGNIFLERAKNEAGIDIRLLKGEEEAYFGYLGSVNSLDINDCLIMDIGGGSTELTLVKNREFKKFISLPFGAITLSENFDLIKNMNDKNIEKLEKFLNSSFEDIEWLAEAKELPLVSIGGAGRNLAKIYKRKNGYPLEKTHNFRMDTSDMKAVYKQLNSSDSEERKNIDGLAKDRVDIITGAAGAIYRLLKFIETDEIIISGSGLREGLIYNRIYPNEVFRNPLDYSLKNIMSKYNLKEKHCFQVYNLTKTMFSEINSIEYTKELDNIIKTASLLHATGIAVSFYNYQNHSFYTILNSRIMGIEQKEILLAALVSTFQSEKKSKINWRKFIKIMDKEDMALVRKIGVLLQIATSLDICIDSKVDFVNCYHNAKSIEINVFSDKDASIEVAHAQLAISNFKKFYNKNLIIH